MQDFITALAASNQIGLYVSVAVFVAAVMVFLALALVLAPVIQTQRRLSQELAAQGFGGRRALAAQAQIRRLAGQRPVDAYFKAMERGAGQTDAIEKRLFEAGFYGQSAGVIYNITRIALVGAAFLLIFTLASSLLGAKFPLLFIFLGSLVFSLAFIVVPSIALDVYANGVKEQYRRGFPDFMDMMITCADAGMSLEAAVERVSTEFAATHRHLGVQLSILTLQLRAGKPLREALRELGDRIGLDEAKTLAVLFRQSEELGTSLVDALRVYSDEMRMQRMLRAEEKANALPVKMVIPLGLCIFPVVMAIVMIPVILRMKGVFF
ncbi:MAG TPA: type II secretion system F family protein [Devosiaceae bacterium]|nr:type II secretion system F family protein [Devosiaceae bacterium]